MGEGLISRVTVRAAKALAALGVGAALLAGGVWALWLASPSKQVLVGANGVELSGFEAMRPPSEGLFPVMQGGLWGFSDKSGKMAVAAAFLEVGSFSEKTAPVQAAPGLWLYVDKAGEGVFDEVFEDALSFSNGMAFAKRGGLWGVLDTAGKWLYPPTVRDVHEAGRAGKEAAPAFGAKPGWAARVGSAVYLNDGSGLAEVSGLGVLRMPGEVRPELSGTAASPVAAQSGWRFAVLQGAPVLKRSGQAEVRGCQRVWDLGFGAFSCETNGVETVYHEGKSRPSLRGSGFFGGPPGWFLRVEDGRVVAESKEGVVVDGSYAVYERRWKGMWLKRFGEWVLLMPNGKVASGCYVSVGFPGALSQEGRGEWFLARSGCQRAWAAGMMEAAHKRVAEAFGSGRIAPWHRMSTTRRQVWPRRDEPTENQAGG